MTRRTIATLLTLTITATAWAGCGKKSGKGDKVNKWLAKPMATKTGTVMKQGFEVQLPEGIKEHEKADFRVNWIPEKGDQFDYPQFGVSKSVMWHPTSPDDAEKQHLSDKLNKGDVILKKATVGKGILLVWRSKKSTAVYAKYFLSGAETKLHSHCLWIEEDGKVPDLDKVAGWLEKVCTTLKLK